MIMAIDVGNTNIKIGLFERSKLCHSWRMYADRDRLLLEGQKFVDEVCDKLGLDKDRLKKDAASDKTARIIAQDLDDAKKLKIDGTPCFLVNGLMVRGALSEPLFEAAVDIALEAAR